MNIIFLGLALYIILGLKIVELVFEYIVYRSRNTKIIKPTKTQKTVMPPTQTSPGQEGSKRK